MSLFASVILSAMLMNPSGLKMDSTQTNPADGILTRKQAAPVVREVAALKGVKVEYSTEANPFKAVKVKFIAGIHFALGESTLNDSTKDVLTQFSKILISNPTTQLAIVGHTDNISSLELNQKLSENRAQAVANFLISQHVSPAQLKDIEGRNYTEPVADNSTEAGRAANRRAEVYIVLSSPGTNISGTSAIPIDSVKTKPAPASLKNLINQVVHQSVKSTDVELEIDGLLVDDTKTKAGKDFYDLFYDRWEAPGAAKNYSITVSEKPFRLTTTLIVISINDDIVYQDILQPRQDLIEAQTQDAIYTTQNYLANYEEITKQLNGADLAGSGIY